MTFNPERIRPQFPALIANPVDEAGMQPVFLDNPAGTQVPQVVIDAVNECYLHHNMCLGGRFEYSQRSERRVEESRSLMADFLNAVRPEEIVFGPNMTTLMFSLSRAIGATLSPGDEILVTRMDHDSNIAPWLRLAEDRDLVIKWVEINPQDCTLDLNSLQDQLSARTKVVAVAHTANTVGTTNPIKVISELAHSAGAICIVDAVQGVPHVPIDVQDLDCDFLLCSSYKFFGPHLGIMYGKYDLMDSLPAYQVRPAYKSPPGRFETGMPNFEAIAGLRAALGYIAGIGRDYGQSYIRRYSEFNGKRLDLKLGMAVMRNYERELLVYLIDMLHRVPGTTIYGITEPDRYDERVPTVSFTLEGHTPPAIADFLGQHHIQVWDGNNYAVEIMKSLGQEQHGLVRVGPVHYNTFAEVDRLETALMKLVD